MELGWGRVLRISVARASLALIAALVRLVRAPLMAGWTPRVILSGSMEPRIHVGDIVVTRTIPAATLAEGQVITVTDPDHPGKTRTHRLLSREANGELVLKGDANREADSSHVSVDDVLGLGVIRVPYVGRPAYWMAERNWLALGATTLFLGWCVVTVVPPPAGPRTTTDGRPGPVPPPAPARPAARVRAASPRPSPSPAVAVGACVRPGRRRVQARRRPTRPPPSAAAKHFCAYKLRGPRRLAVPLLAPRRDQRHRHRRRRAAATARTARCSRRPPRSTRRAL